MLVLSLANIALANGALPGDVQPPWWRGQWSTTTQYWEFWTPDPGPGLLPDGPGPLVEGDPGQPYNPGYLPSTMLWVQPFGDWIQFDPASGREGIWPLSGIIEIIVDNHEPINPKKIV